MLKYKKLSMILRLKKIRQAGAECGQAQLKLELKLCYKSFEILSYSLLQLVVASGLPVISYTPCLIVFAE